MHTPLQLAAYNGEADCVKVLLENGANGKQEITLYSITYIS